ncbi:helix-turn-helix domain-containing protein [Nocardiopsis potens]|uniref:helix-turn-helix domain-containing protein n=1 Tax=Nocardiopsis potens TaxID=1246458 RepID=UPI00034988FD|nr:helix-turn-helix transcriptional regulator [Nocardiopsis potens]
MAANQPTVAGRGLGAELRSIREEHKLSSTKVAKRLGWPQSKISKIENGKQSIRAADVASLLAVYGVIGHERDHLIAKAENSDEAGLWEKQSGMSRESRTLIQLEAEATGIFNLEPLILPGLLQTPDYIRALMTTGGISEEDTEVRTAARLGRQALLSRQTPPRTEFVIDECALRRPLLPPRLMARQLRHIIEATERPTVTVQVLPLSLGGHRGLDGPFMLLEFAKLRSVVHVEHKISAFFLEEEQETAFYRQEADSLRESALNPAESVDFIAGIVRELDREG